MRISSFDQYHRIQTNIGRIQMNMATYQFQMATGVKFQKPSDSPIAAKQLEVIRHSLGKIEQYQRNANDAIGILETVETSLGEAYGVLDTVNQTAIQARNDTYTLSDLDALAGVVDSAIEQMISIGNTKHLGKYVFAGEKYDDKPFSFDGTTITYNGSSNDVDFMISPYIHSTVVRSGEYVLLDVLQGLVDIRDNIRLGDKTALDVNIEELKGYMDAVSNYQAEIGVGIKSLETTMEGFEEQSLNLEARRSYTEDIDYTEVLIDYSITQRAYEGTLKATAMMFDTSILNYI